MLLTISTSHVPATDLGFLLHKNPVRVQRFDLSFGQAHVFYPEASEQRCTAALLVDVDALQLTRGRGSRRYDYVNDRPYVASSFLSVALAKVFGSALGGKSTSHAELVATPIPLEATLPVVGSSGGAELLERLFCPLGWELEAVGHLADEAFPDWGHARYFSVRLRGKKRLQELLEHLYVLLPVLDNEKHYWFGRDELDKLLRRGGEWLAVHPDKELIVARYLRYQRRLTSEALEHLVAEDVADPQAVDDHDHADLPGERVRLADARIGAVVSVLKAAGARRVLDVGCGAGSLMKVLLADPAFETIGGMDVAANALEAAARRLHLERMPPRQRERVTLFPGWLVYRDDRLRGWDALTCVEVGEHLDPPRLEAFERILFGHAGAPTIVLTTPNREHNVRFESLVAGEFRHRDHPFEWTRAEFAEWTAVVADRYGYTARRLPVGPDDNEVGPPTQMAVFTKEAGS
jgi:3' terminal RNA ribose 2'-O-methyltransferase Hen1